MPDDVTGIADSHYIRRQVPNDHACANLSATVVRYEATCFVGRLDLRYVDHTVQGVRTRNGNLSTLRSSLSSWNGVRRHVKKECQRPQGSGSPGADFLVKRAVVDSGKLSFSRMILGNP
jgi:hypothetical protein